MPAPKNGRKSTFAFVPGTYVKMDCDPGYVLMGEDRFLCLSSAEWTWSYWGQPYCVGKNNYKLIHTQKKIQIKLGIVEYLMQNSSRNCFGYIKYRLLYRFSLRPPILKNRTWSSLKLLSDHDMHNVSQWAKIKMVINDVYRTQPKDCTTAARLLPFPAL